MRQLAACRRLSQRNVLACGLTTEPGSGPHQNRAIFSIARKYRLALVDEGLHRLAMIGGFLLGGPTINDSGLNLTALVVSFIGAVILLGIVNLVRRGRVR